MSNVGEEPRRGREESGDPFPEFVDQVMSLVQEIPPGCVMTYGDIAFVLTARAERAGLTESYGPRMVGFVMSRFGGTLPWWRVIRSTGHPPRFHQEQARPHYLDEETPLIGPADSYRIDLKRARYLPDGADGPSDQGAS
jgi:alkylated DNA nucleotide flippase Atl1